MYGGIDKTTSVSFHNFYSVKQVPLTSLNGTLYIYNCIKYCNEGLDSGLALVDPSTLDLSVVSVGRVAGYIRD